MKSIFVQKAPYQLPQDVKKQVAEILPWINISLGLLGLIAAGWAWITGQTVNRMINNTNTLLEFSGGTPVDTLGVFFWTSLLILVAVSVLLIASVPGLKERSLVRGWNLAYYATLLNGIYGLVVLVSEQADAPLRCAGAVLVSVVGLYVLWQLRDQYTDKKHPKN